MRLTYTVLTVLLFGAFTSVGQVCEMVSLQTNYAVQQFYSLDSGLMHTIDVQEWDLRFNYFDYTIEINEAKGLKCWTKTNFDNANPLVGTSNASYNPSNLDTVGMQTGQNDWVALHNDPTAKTLQGALNRIMQTPPKGGVQEYGHSFYAPSGSYAQMHGIHGYRNFVVQLANGQFIQVFPEISHSSTQQVIGLSNLDGGNNRNLTFDKNLYVAQQWTYFKHAGDVLQPPTFGARADSWDLMFTEYYDEIYAEKVVGAIANVEVGLEQLDGVDYYNATFFGNYDADVADIIGHDWKTESSPGQYQMVPQRNYLVQTVHGNEYLMYFCDFGGAVNGNIEFRVIPRAQIEGMIAPQAEFTATASDICVGNIITFTNNSADENLVEWLAPGFQENGSNANSVALTYHQSGAYDIGLVAYFVDANNDTIYADTSYFVNFVEVGEFATAGFTFSQSSQTFHFTDQSAQADSTVYLFGDGNSSNASNPSHTYASAGNYSVTQIAYASCGNDTLIQTVTAVSPVNAPVASFSSTDNNLCMVETIDFVSTSSEATSFEWIFNGGTPATSTDEHPSVVYVQAGAFDVTLIVANSIGADTLEMVQYVTVNHLPVAGFTLVQDTSTVAITNTATYANGVQYFYGNGAFSLNPNPTFTYADTGLFNLLQVASNDCGVDSMSYTVHIEATNDDSNLGMNPKHDLESLSVYPNPFRNSFDISGLLTEDEVTLYNAVGVRVVLRKTGATTFRTEDLSPGVYWLVVSNPSLKTSRTIRLIKL